MNAQTLSLTALLPVTALACAPALADGPTATEVRPVQGFERIEVAGGFDVQIERGETHRVVVTAPKDVIGKVRTERSGDTLEIDFEGLRFSDPDIHVQVILPHLKALDVSGAVAVKARRLAGERLTVEASGASKLSLSGEVTEVSYDISGATKLDALALDAERVKIEASGASAVKVRAKAALSADASGATTIKYSGDPETLHTDLSGASVIKKI